MVDLSVGGGTETKTLDFLHGFLQYLQPKVIVEAGTCQGDFTTLARYACPSAQIYTADIFKHEWIADVGKIATFFFGDFEKMLREQLVGIEVDFAFIDSGPPPVLPPGLLEPGVRLRHYEAVTPYMREGGIIATHDTAKLDWRGVHAIVEDADIQLNCGRGLSLRQI